MDKNMRKSAFRNTLRVFFARGPIVIICSVIVLLFFFAAIFAPILTPYTETQQDLLNTFAKPSGTHLFGTDSLGRDVFTRILYGARVSLITSLISSVLALVVGSFLGMVAGYLEGAVGQLIMRITDAQLSLPPLIVSMTLATALGGGIWGVSIVIAISILPTYVRMVNGLVLTIKNNDFVVVAPLVGQTSFQVLYKHLFPNCFPSLIVLFTMNLGGAIMLESSLSFLGIGITAPVPAWGSMVSDGYQYLFKAPSLAIVPGIFVMLTVIAFNIVGDSLRDSLDPRLRGKL
ncbi:MAG: ABC transporter permease [Spirochaetales bacterium]|nr:ABC transporter permease [Spirochaetales bacterium]MBQ3696541.1 ABC transporter permease [Spirochaetales bacterium]MBQ3729069.1 ABC transporter permease [Spirochaetales bacterium]MBQ9810958.1 ABC transporter permease [Spirochaetales bacterium]MCR5443365.1 ABC transporter permease [Sphaerochaetaceae bacterium]